ncbi:phage terminase small subunit-related protein [Paenibacillus lautus]|uniref:phage terminase small subunit-related protein n=1 Tax=Paenibacillus lautus TaxID=1401 RepID=UPI0038513A41
MWLKSGGTMKLKDIAAALSIGETQVRKWKSHDKWATDLNSNVTNESKGNVTKRGAPKGNKNAVGNRGGAPAGNQRAVGNKGGSGGPLRNKKAVTTVNMKRFGLMRWKMTNADCLIRSIRIHFSRQMKQL